MPLRTPPLQTHLRRLREAAGLSQQALASLVGVQRQAILAIESGRQVPSTVLALKLAQALRVPVEEIFSLPSPPGVAVELAAADAPSPRALVGRVAGRWVAHPLPPLEGPPADALIHPTGRAELLVDPERLGQRVLVAGCAPLLGVFVGRDADWRWIPASTGQALDALEAGWVHIAGLHAVNSAASDANERLLASRFAGRTLHVVHLTRWRQGLLVQPGNPLGIHTLLDLGRADVRFARRAAGSGAMKLARTAVGDGLAEGPNARGHVDVARLVQWGAADAGVAIESVALALGLDFVPLSEERFDLAFFSELADDPRIVRFVESLGARGFRAEASSLAGYDVGAVGESRLVGAP